MFTKFRIAIGSALLLSLVFAIPAFAGGWAVITLDELPANVVAGEPLTIGFTVRQHGHTPMNGLSPIITANLHKDVEFVVGAEPSGKPGHYTATLTFPKEGEWRWSIQAFSMNQFMPMLPVAAPGEGTSQVRVETKPVIASVPPLVVVRGLALLFALVGLVLAYQQKSRLALALPVAAIVVALASYFMGSGVQNVEARTQGASLFDQKSDPILPQVELGRQLFIAKGCITCHYNERAAKRHEYWTIDMGAPDLSTYSSVPEVLFVRLKDPAAAKSDTKMPDLELKETEIEALIAFINS